MTKRTPGKREALTQDLLKLGEIYSTETALFQQQAAAALHLGVTDLKALSALVREGPMTAGQLTQRLGLTTGAGTLLVDRLTRAGYVERQPHATDRRKVMVSMNRSRLPATDQVYEAMGAAFAKLLDRFSVTELECLVRFHRAAIELTQREIARLNAVNTRLTEPEEGPNPPH